MFLSFMGFIISFLLCFLLVPLIRRLGYRLKIVDLPNYRKIHNESTPCTGGLAIYGAFFGTIGILILLSSLISLFEIKKLMGIIVGSTLLVILGIYDDKKPIKAIYKLIFQIIIILIVYNFNLKIDHIFLIQLGWISIPITIIWFCGFINVINLIDGLDGLACGIVFIISSALFIAATLLGDVSLGLLSASLSGATLAFLRFNFVEEKIFLGDNGSLLSGFLIAALPLLGTIHYKSATVSLFLITLICAGVPIYDTAAAIIRRIKSKKPIFEADKNHIHHQLLAKGLSPKQVVITLYGITSLLAIIALIFTITKQVIIGIVILLVSIVIFVLKKTRALSKLHRLITR